MITVKSKAGMLAGAILTAAVVSTPAQAATYNYITDFDIVDTASGLTIWDITGTIDYNGPATFSSTFQDMSLIDANTYLSYNWNINSPFAGGAVGNFTDSNSFWNAFTNPPLNTNGFPFPFEISQDRIVLKPLVDGQNVQLFTDDQLNGISIADSTNGLSYILGEAAPIPTPALLPGLLGFGATLVRRKKQQTEAAA